MTKYISYLDNISVDEKLHERTMELLAMKTVPITKNRTVFRYAGMAACVAVLILCAITIPALLKNTDADIPYNLGSTSIIGLPVENFSLADLHRPDGETQKRFLYSRMSDFYSFDAPSFAFVRVIRTEQQTDPSVFLSQEKQISTLQILSSVWSKSELPKIISVTQSKFGGCCEGEKTNLLREGGVYLLPLVYLDEGDKWFVAGDVDVLFEVDEKGLIWSHSQQEGFNCFDGQSANAAADAIIVLTSDENFPAAITTFGIIASNWGVLAEATVIESAVGINQWGLEQNLLELKAESILSIAPNDWHTWQFENGDEFRAVSWCHLKQGTRYLILFDPSEGGPNIEERNVAIINADGTITAVSKDSNFTEFNGCTSEYMKVQAEHSIAWHTLHAG